MAQKTGVYVQCEYCGKTVYKTQSQYKKRKQHFCSNRSLVNDRQRHVISRDKAKHTYLKNYYNIEILYLWESDIIKRPDVCVKLIRHYIKCGGDINNYHSFNYSIADDRLVLNDVIVRPYQDGRKEIAC